MAHQCTLQVPEPTNLRTAASGKISTQKKVGGGAAHASRCAGSQPRLLRRLCVLVCTPIVPPSVVERLHTLRASALSAADTTSQDWQQSVDQRSLTAQRQRRMQEEGAK